MSQTVNNFFEGLVNSTNPQYSGVPQYGPGLTSGDRAGQLLNSYVPPPPTYNQIIDRNLNSFTMPPPPSSYSFNSDPPKSYLSDVKYP